MFIMDVFSMDDIQCYMVQSSSLVYRNKECNQGDNSSK